MCLKDYWKYVERVSDKHIKELPPENRLITDLDEGGVWYEDGKTIVAIDGSSGIDEWISNFEFRPNNYGIHHEFYNSALEFYKILKVRPDIIIGYSRGGGLAQCLAYLFNTECVTFGSPRVCNLKGLSLFNKTKFNHTRVYIPSDPVTHVPCWWMGFKHYQTKNVKLKNPKGFSHTHYKEALDEL